MDGYNGKMTGYEFLLLDFLFSSGSGSGLGGNGFCFPNAFASCQKAGFLFVLFLFA